jgi:hypothetical protein
MLFCSALTMVLLLASMSVFLNKIKPFKNKILKITCPTKKYF